MHRECWHIHTYLQTVQHESELNDDDDEDSESYIQNANRICKPRFVFVVKAFWFV